MVTAVAAAPARAPGGAAAGQAQRFQTPDRLRLRRRRDVLSAPREARAPVGHARARRAAGGPVVVVDAQPRLHHHVAVVVPVLAVLICGGREHKRLSERGAARTDGKTKGSRPGFRCRSGFPTQGRCRVGEELTRILLSF